MDEVINEEFDIKSIPDHTPFVLKPLLGRPTDKSITINLMTGKDLDIYFEYGYSKDSLNIKTKKYNLKSFQAEDITLKDLKPDTQYYYRVIHGDNKPGKIFQFHTQRKKGKEFVFAVMADTHLDDKSDRNIYKKTLTNIIADAPDFLIDLGDNFMVDKIRRPTYKKIEGRHLLLRSYYDIICSSLPLFLVQGNHECEMGWELKRGKRKNTALWNTKARHLYYPNPFPDDFYSGCMEKFNDNYIENYYSWEWGDALFIVIDPYRYALEKPKRNNDPWAFTLGEVQYKWLKDILKKSKAAHKFIFSHQIVGGDVDGRGGAEYVDYYEMGGKNEDQSYGFKDKRPGWDMPLHRIFVKYKVDIFFHGHDHFYAKQEKDSVIYQLVPQPSHDNYRVPKYISEYGYKEGKLLGNAGHLRLFVKKDSIQVDYIRAFAGKKKRYKKFNIDKVSTYFIDKK